MAIPSNPVSLGDPTKKAHYDTLYDNAVLADTGGTAGGAQTIPGVKTFSAGLIAMMDGNIHTVTGNYTILDNDNYKQVLVTTATATATVALPTLAANLHRTILIMKADAGTGEVYIEGEGAETINGNATMYLTYQYQFAMLVATASEWIIYGGNPSPIASVIPVEHEYLFKEDAELDYSASFTDGMAAADITFTELPANTVEILAHVYWSDTGVVVRLVTKRTAGGTQTYEICLVAADAGTQSLRGNHWIPTNGNSIRVTNVTANTIRTFRVIGFKTRG